MIGARSLVTGAMVAACAACSSSGASPGPVVGGGADADVPGSEGGAPAPGSDASMASADATATDGMVVALDAGVGPGALPDAAMDPPSHGGTLTFESIGATGWYPSRRDPKTGPCDALDSGTCCLATDTIPSNQLTPWDEDLIVTLRGPMVVAQMAVYQPATGGAGGAASAWDLVSSWSGSKPAGSQSQGIAFDGNGTQKTGFAGSIGTECLVNVSTSQTFPCGPGSVPYCPTSAAGHAAYQGWSGSKLFVILATMPHAPAVPGACSTTTTGNWYDAPWIGFSVGELVRAGAFSSCQCYAKDPSKGYLADGCGQFNAFEVVNDNNSYKNLDVFSTDLIDYSGYVGEGPCGPKCAVSALSPAADLIDKSTDTEAAQGAVAMPGKGPGAALRRPESGYRYFLVLLDVASRTVQLGMVHPLAVPTAIAPLLPGLPATVGATTIDAVRALRLPK